MPGNATTTANPITSYGSDATANQVRPGGSLGSGRYYPIVNPSTGTIDVYRYTPARGGSQTAGVGQSTQIGSIPRGGTFNVRSRTDGTPYASGAEIQHFGSTAGRQQFRDNAQQVVTRQWQAGGQPQPPPNTIINGNNSLSAAYGSTGTAGELLDSTDAANRQISGRSTTDTQPNQSQAQSQASQAMASLLNNRPGQVQRSNTSLGPNQVVVYPVSLRQEGNNSQDTLKLQMLQYSPRELGATSSTNLSGVGGRSKNRTTLGSVVLPIPGNIMDTNVVSWGGDSMDPLAAAMANVAYTAITKGVEKGATEFGDLLKQAGANAGPVKKALGSAIAGFASKTGAQLLQRTEGAIMNPNMELLFNNPSLRQFNFSWKLAPRSSDEAQEVIKIIRFFKQGMAPIREAPNLFLKSPNTWKLTYKHKASDHKYLNKFKECAMLNCGIQYTPDGSYATFEDGVMTSYQMTLSFQELDPVYSDDYSDIPNDQIGF